jgi:hypothetical protein
VTALPGLIFFASGFAALVYQILWQRLLVIFSGSDVHSATIIVAAFMAGLGCGNLAGAQAADRLPPRANLACFAAAEIAIAAFGFFSADLYPIDPARFLVLYLLLPAALILPPILAVTWSPTARVHNTFVSVFPHILSYGDIVIGSNQPIAFDAPAIHPRPDDPRVRADYGRTVVDIDDLLQPYLARVPHLFSPDDDRSHLTDINADLFPKDEFSVP